MVTSFILIFSENNFPSQDLLAVVDHESVGVQATMSEGAAASGDVRSSSESADKAVGQSPRVIEIGSDMSQIEAQIGLDDDTEVPTESKVRI